MIKPEYAVTADGHQLDSATITDNYIKAVNVNRSIIVNAQAAQMSLYEVCKGLKEMRDDKLYKELGYQSFEEYCEKETGIKRSQAYKFISIYEKMPEENVHTCGQIGVSKLYLLSTLSEEERAEISENNNLEEISKRQLEEKIKEIKALKEKNDEQSDYIMSLETQNAEKDSSHKSLKSELDNIRRQRQELMRQIKELESQPIDVAVSESSTHEIENLRMAMRTCDNQWAKKYRELEEENIEFNRKIHQDYKAQIEQLTVDYEKKLSEAPELVQLESVSEQVAIPDVKETFKAYYSLAYNAFTSLVTFVTKQNNNDDKLFCKEKADKLVLILKDSIKEI